MDDLSWSQFTPNQGARPDPVRPRFYLNPVEQRFKSEQAGRPIYEDREFVEIIVPGNRTATVHEEVSDDHRARWPREYAAFKQGLEQPVSGTPIEQWPPISQARALELRAVNVRTVEDLAAVSDGLLQNLGMGARELRTQARTWLDAAKNGAAPIARLVAENQAKDDEIALLKRQLAEQAQTIEGLRAEKKEAA